MIDFGDLNLDLKTYIMICLWIVSSSVVGCFFGWLQKCIVITHLRVRMWWILWVCSRIRWCCGWWRRRRCGVLIQVRWWCWPNRCCWWRMQRIYTNQIVLVPHPLDERIWAQPWLYPLIIFGWTQSLKWFNWQFPVIHQRLYFFCGEMPHLNIQRNREASTSIKESTTIAQINDEYKTDLLNNAYSSKKKRTICLKA